MKMLKKLKREKSIMRTEKGVAIIAYKEIRGSKRFLILKRTKNWEGWELPKGHLEEDDYAKTVEIELEEEASIEKDEIISVDETDETLEWSYEDEGEKVNREYNVFIVKIKEEASVDTTENPSDEHETGFFMKKEDVESLLTYDNQKELIANYTEILKNKT